MLTTEILLKAAAEMRKHAIPPKTVQSLTEAKRFTAADPAQHQWSVGEEYYELRTINGKLAITGSR